MSNDDFGDLRPFGYGDATVVQQYPPRGPVWVYTHLDATGRPLYIGATSDPGSRLKKHRRVARWFAEVVDVRYVGPFGEHEGARVEERMIRAHQPAHNKQHKQDPIEDFIVTNGGERRIPSAQLGRSA